MLCHNRYVLQVLSDASQADEAIRQVLAKWRRSVLALGLSRFSLVRAEVMTLEELEAEASSQPDIVQDRCWYGLPADRGRALPR